MSVLDRFGLLFREESSVGARHVPTSVAFVLAILTLAVPGVPLTSTSLVVVAVLVWISAVVVAALATYGSVDARFRLAVPLLDLLAIGILRMATGDVTSPYTALLVLPLIAMASEPQRRALVYGVIGTAVAILLPYAGLVRLGAQADLLRAVLIPLVFGVAGLSVFLLTNRLRRRAEAIERLRREQATLLEHARADGRAIALTSSLLEQTNRMTASVIDAVTEQSIIGTNEFGLIEVWNPGAEKMLDIPAVEAVGILTITDLHVRSELAKLVAPSLLSTPGGADARTGLGLEFEALVAGARGDQPEFQELTYLRRDRTAITVELAVTARRGPAGDIVGFIFVATDITRSVEAARLKDEFVSLISHELRTPLSSILGYLELVADDPERPLTPVQAQYLGVVERNANRLMHLVADLLFTAQVEAGRFALDLQSVDLVAVAKSSTESAMPSARRRGIDLVLELPTTPVLLDGDATRLGQACDNLISNAVKFSAEQSKVIIRVSGPDAVGSDPAARRATLSVSDSGVGIPANELAQLFGRYFRASTATQHAVQGIGLGLTITRAIVTAHRGEIAVASVEGVGTTFSLLLPMSESLGPMVGSVGPALVALRGAVKPELAA